MLVIAAALGFQSCSDDDKGSTAATALSVTDANGIEISQIDFNLAQSSKMIGIKTDGDWTVSIPDADTTWLSITPHAGYGWEINDTAASNTRSFVRVEAQTNSGDARTSTITVTSGSFTSQIPVSQKGATTDPNDPFMSAWTFVANLKMGYNLGNTLDANPNSKQSWWQDRIAGKSGRELAEIYETSWGQPLTTQKIIDDIHAQGFNIIRVPVTWYPHMDADNNIDAAWMARVKEVVDMALADGNYVILNVMHDVGAASGNDDIWLMADPDTYAQNTIKYQAIWRQIAEEFKDYDDHLVFESFNEILNKNSSWTPPAAGDASYTIVNRLQQDFVNTVRATGGNNEYRNLAITTYAATGNNTVPLNELEVPTDIHPNHIYGTIHSYDPYNFCSDNGDYNIYVFDSDCQSEIDNIFGQVDERFNELGIPYIYGEFGAIDDNKDMNERVKYATYVSQKMKQYHTTGLWWMGLYDRSTNTWYENLIVNALKSGFGIN